MSTKNSSKHLARFLALQYFFTVNRAKQIQQDLLVFEPSALLNLIEVEKFDNHLYEQIVEGVEKKLTEIDEIIQKFAPLRPLNEINIVDLLILRIAVWEGFIEKITPPKVAIDEAIELAKSFGDKENGSFVNGVLANLLEKTSI